MVLDNIRVGEIGAIERTGRVISDSGYRPSQSFVIQFLQGLYTALGDSIIGVKQVGWTGGNPLFYVVAEADGLIDRNHWMCLQADEQDSSFGVVVGTDNSAEDSENTALGSQVLQGSGVTELMHGPVSFISESSISGSDAIIEVSRMFFNQSGGTITIKEVGLYARIAGYYVNLVPPPPLLYSTGRICLSRDVVADTDIPDGYTLTVQMMVKVTN